MSGLEPGSIAWAALAPHVGREQAGRRPVVVVSSAGYLDVVTTLAIVVPVSSTDRGWPNHVRLLAADTARPLAGFALTEQVRTVSRDRLAQTVGTVSDGCLAEIRMWLRDFLDR